jgi:tetratricopeptide (TPR) repeat protein
LLAPSTVDPTPRVRRTLALNQRIEANTADVEAMGELAELYDKNGAYEMALAQWQRVLDREPTNDEAREKLERVQADILRSKGASLRQRTLELLESLGPESARQLYSQTVQIYEQLLRLDPGDNETHRHLEELTRRFQRQNSAGEAPPLNLLSAEVENLFPALMQRYREHPVGRVILENTSDRSVLIESVSFHIARFMDYPWERSMRLSMAPGARNEIDVQVLLSTAAFDLEEDLPVLGRLEVVYRSGGNAGSVKKPVPLLLHRRTALVWDQTGKLASFVTPREETIAAFAHAVADTGDSAAGYRLSGRLIRAIRIVDALGVYGIAYIEDPDAPITSVLGRPGFVDTVRFPRTTLVHGSGDCDDSTALLASLLEAAGIRTAVMTSPGHVFLAFDSGESAENRWALETGGLATLESDGAVWIPIETTVLDRGFMKAWRSGSDLLHRHRDTEKIEFLPIHELRAEFAPLPLPATGFDIAPPGPDRVDPQFQLSLAGLEEELYRGPLGSLELELAAATGRARSRTGNRIGALHALFGRIGKARQILEQTIREDPAYIPPYVNTANLYLSEGRAREAIEVLEGGLAARPNSVILNLLMARACDEAGDAARAERHFAIVTDRAPATAARYARYFGVGVAHSSDVGAPSRAGNEGFPLAWIDE